MTAEEVVILGAGITGLAIAHQLRRSRPSLKLTILARDLPCDEPYSQSFGSVWAGADWSAFASEGSLEAKWEQQTYEAWLESSVAPTLIALVDVEKHVEEDAGGKWSLPWWRDVVKEFTAQQGENGQPGILRFKSFCLDAPAYLLHLFKTLVDVKTLSSSDGLVNVHRREISSLDSVATQFPHAKLLINASGLGAYQLVLNGDESCHFIRGQTLLVQLPAGVEPKIFTGVNSFSSTVAKEAGQDKSHELSYIIPRARSGKVILGGSYEPDRKDKEEDVDQTKRILQSSAKLWPELVPPPSTAKQDSDQNWERIKVLKVNVGFRPGRSAGPRVELVCSDGSSSSSVDILHAYGLGGAGYQRSVGLAMTVDDMLDGVLSTRRLSSS